MSQDSASSRILTLVFTDLVESTALKVTQGDVLAGELIARHRIIDFVGDGCFLSFETPRAARAKEPDTFAAPALVQLDQRAN